MNKNEWIRDLSFYILAASTLVVYGYVGKVNFLMALGFLGIYLVYFSIVLFVRKTKSSCLKTDLTC